MNQRKSTFDELETRVRYLELELSEVKRRLFELERGSEPHGAGR